MSIMENIMTNPLYWGPASMVPPWRRATAATLQGASTVLARWAGGLVSNPRRPVTEMPRVEFHAEAGAPEGALYLDGELVGWLEGVQRL